jgi:hypothetical protein
MKLEKLTIDLVQEIAIDLLDGESVQAHLRTQSLLALAQSVPPIPSLDRESSIALCAFLELGAAQKLEQTGNIYLDAAIYLDMQGFYHEAAALATTTTSIWVGYFAGIKPNSYFRRTPSNASLREYLQWVDSHVNEDGSMAFSIDERIESASKRRGRRSIYVLAWLMAVTDAEEVPTESNVPASLHP